MWHLESNFDSIYESLLTSYALQITTFENISIFLNETQHEEIEIIIDFLQDTTVAVNVQIYYLQNVLNFKQATAFREIVNLLVRMDNNLLSSTSNSVTANSTIDTSSIIYVALQNFTLILPSIGMTLWARCFVINNFLRQQKFTTTYTVQYSVYIVNII